MRRWPAPLIALLLASTGVAGVTFIGESSQGNNLNEIPLSTPAGTAPGDALVAVLSLRGGASVGLSPPPGWSALGRTDHGDTSLAVFTRTATADEPSSHPFTLSSRQRVATGIAAYRGVQANDIVAGPVQSGTGSTAVAPSVDAAAGSLLVGVFAVGGHGTWTPPEGMTERIDQNSAGGQGTTILVADATAAGGATGTRSATASTSGETIALLLLLPEPVPPEVSLSVATASGYEWEAPSVEVLLSHASAGDVTVSLTASGTAAGADITLSASVTVPAGATAVALPLAIVDDDAQEPDETVVVTLDSPAGATLGAVDQLTYTIRDDDPLVLPEPAPVGADGAPLPNDRWGGWAGGPGETDVDAANYLVLRCRGPPGTTFTVDFTPSTFSGEDDPTETLDLDGNVAFASWEDTSGVATPADGVFAFGGASATGSHAGPCAAGSTVFVTYRILLLPDPHRDQEYSAPFTVDST